MKIIATNSLAVIFLLSIIFHLLVLFKVIPFTIIWGGRLKKAADIYILEMTSLLLNTGFLVIVLIKSKYFNVIVSDTILSIVLWAMAIVFILNTIGNLFSKNNFERKIVTPITLLVTILLIILLKSE